VGLVVRQQGRGQAGVVAVVDPVEGVGQLLGLVSGDEGRRPPVKDRPGHGGGGRDLLEAGRENQRRASEIAAPEGQGLGLDGGLHTGVDLLEPGGGVQSRRRVLAGGVSVGAVDDGELHQLPLLQLVLTVAHCQQLLDFIHCPLEFEGCSVLRVLDCDQHVELVIEMLPVGFAPVLFLLLLVPHGALPPDHHLAARLLLQLLGCQPSGSKDSSDKVKLWMFFDRNINFFCVYDGGSDRLGQTERLLHVAVDLKQVVADLSDL